MCKPGRQQYRLSGLLYVSKELKRTMRITAKHLISIAILIVVIAYLITSRSRLPRQDVTYAILDIPSILGDSWNTTGVRQPEVLEDLEGRPSSLIGRAEIEARHEDDFAVFIDQLVFLYGEEDEALARYMIQDEVIFYEFPDRLERYPWNDIEIGSNLNADEIISLVGMTMHLRWILAAPRFLLYGRHVVYFNMWTMRNGIEYISIQDMESLFNEIDAILSI